MFKKVITDLMIGICSILKGSSLTHTTSLNQVQSTSVELFMCNLTFKQTNKQTHKWWEHNLLGGGNKVIPEGEVFHEHFIMFPRLWFVNPNISSLRLWLFKESGISCLYQCEFRNLSISYFIFTTPGLHKHSLADTLSSSVSGGGCHVLYSTRDQKLSKHPLKLLVLQGSIWSVCQIKLQRFALVRNTTLVTAVFWLRWLTHKHLWPWGLAGCSLTLS